MTDFNQYVNYLQTRSQVGKFYRFYWLYPKLSKYLSLPSLDIGCGIGDMLKFNKGMIGTDINPLIVKLCKKNNLDVYQMQDDALPFADNSFSSILLDNVIEHITSPKPLLKEIQKKIKRNGIFIVGVPGIEGYKSDDDHKIFYTEDQLIKLVCEFGFDYTKTIYSPVKSNWLNNKMRQYCIYCIFQSK